MNKVVWHVTMSLDGFIAGPDDAMEWAFEYPEAPLRLAEDAVRTAGEAAGDKNLEIFGANLAAQCLDHGLIDEMVVHVAPVLLGGGVRLYGEAGSRAQVRLELIDRTEAGELQSLRFRVSR